ncbi:MAG: class I SAM-dependent methyltransferase [Nitrospinae bacterium]|nr:class I SAM-dependent methyltransferase [Nitrospinota bacterium]
MGNKKPWWEKWDNSAKSFDIMNAGVEVRYGDKKRELIKKTEGLILLAAVGTGLDLQYFPQNRKVVGIDISWKMLEKSSKKLADNPPDTTLVRGDIQKLCFSDNTFDSVVTSCTFCSVPDPVLGLQELRRVLKPGGTILMFEHVRSTIFWMGPMQDFITVFTRKFGPDLNRDTRTNILKAGFTLKREENLYLDMVKLFEAEK